MSGHFMLYFIVFIDRYIAETKAISLADVIFLANFASLVECEFYPDLFKDFPSLYEWFERCKKLIPNYIECNEKGAKMFGGWFKSFTSFAIRKTNTAITNSFPLELQRIP